MKTHNEKYGPQLLALLMGEAEGRAKTKIEAHLAGCESCQAEMEELRATVGMLNEELAGEEKEVVPLEETRVEALTASGANPEKKSRTRLFSLRPMWIAPAMAALFLAVFLGTQSGIRNGELSDKEIESLNHYIQQNASLKGRTKSNGGAFGPYSAGVGGLDAPESNFGDKSESHPDREIAMVPAEAVGGEVEVEWQVSNFSFDIGESKDQIAVDSRLYRESDDVRSLGYVGDSPAASAEPVRSRRKAGAIGTSTSRQIAARPKHKPIPRPTPWRTPQAAATSSFDPRRASVEIDFGRESSRPADRLSEVDNLELNGEFASSDDLQYNLASPAQTERLPQGTPVPDATSPQGQEALRKASIAATYYNDQPIFSIEDGLVGITDEATDDKDVFGSDLYLSEGDEFILVSPVQTQPLPQATPVPEPYVRKQRRPEAEPPAERWEYRGGRTEPPMMYFRNYGVNPFVATGRDPLSTFAVDVDKASYAIVRNYLNREILPPTAAVRVEEIVNYFTPDYAPPTNDTFAVYNTMAPSPFRKGHHLLRVGIQGRKEGEYERKPLVLTFVVDVSGSMSQENRLGLVKRTLLLLLDELRPEDRIGIAVYESRGRQVMGHRYVRDGRKIKRAINGLRTGGSTYAEEGIRIGFDMARRAFDPSATNRVILCSDGVANVGNTGPEAILRRIEEAAGEDIYLSSLGFGMGNYNDELMEQLANKGNGHYAYLDTYAEAKRFVRKDLVSSMNVIAQDVKIQVEFDPASVSHYRLLGYENRDVRDRDFRNDRVDAGEIGAGHATTALYELNLNPHGNDRIATVRIRFKDTTRNMAVREIQGPVARSSAEAPFFDTSDHFQLVAAASQYAEILRESYLSRGIPMSQVLSVFGDALGRRPRNDEAKDLRKLIVKADRLLGDRDDVPMVLTEQFRGEEYEDVPMPGRVPMTESGGAPRR